MIKVLIADDHAFVRRGLSEFLGAHDDIDVVASVADGSAAVASVLELRPDVVLMDISMPAPGQAHALDGIAATQAIADAGYDIKVVILTSSAERKTVLDAINAGAVGYLLKDREPEDLVRAIRAAAAGGSPLDPRVAPVVLTARGSRALPELRGREREIVLLLVEGLTNRAIGERLGISEKTVKSHLTKVFHQYRLRNRGAAIEWAQRIGLASANRDESSPPR